MVDFAIRGIRQTLPSGYFLGRLSPGAGQAELLTPADMFHSMGHIAWQVVGPPNIKTSGTGIANSGGTLAVEWNAGQVNAIGSGLAISATTLAANWRLGVVSALSGITLTAGTLTASIPPQQWNAGTVTTIGSGLAILSGTLTNTSPDTNIWNAGTVSHIGNNVTVSAGTISASGPVLPLCNGDAGPVLMDDGNGQCIGVAI